jgi:hypothetical protein
MIPPASKEVVRRKAPLTGGRVAPAVTHHAPWWPSWRVRDGDRVNHRRGDDPSVR